MQTKNVFMFLQEKFVIFALIGLLETHLQDDYNTTQTIFMSLRLQSCVLQCQACPVWGCHKICLEYGAGILLLGCPTVRKRLCTVNLLDLLHARSIDQSYLRMISCCGITTRVPAKGSWDTPEHPSFGTGPRY